MLPVTFLFKNNALVIVLLGFILFLYRLLASKHLVAQCLC